MKESFNNNNNNKRINNNNSNNNNNNSIEKLPTKGNGLILPRLLN